MKRKALKTAAFATALTLGAALLATGPTAAHGTGGYGYRGGSGMHGGQMGPGMMGHMGGMMGHMGPGMKGHMGPGMKGHMGPGMMGHMGGMMGHMGAGMMGPGAGGQGGCPYQQAALTEELTVESVTKFLERRLSHMGNDRLKVGEVKVKDDNTIIAEIVTVDDSLVQRIEFDRKTGQRRQVR